MLRPRRRDVLRALAAGSLGAAVACRGDRPASVEGRIVDEDHAVGHRLRDGALRPARFRREKVPVLIAGGGVSGLAAAWRLRRAGFEDLRVCELGADPGGTARSGTMQGLDHPWGAHYLPSPLRHQRALVAFLKDAGLAEGFAEDGRLQVPMRDIVRAPQERLFAVGEWSEDLWLGAGASARDRDELRRFTQLVDEHAARHDARGQRSFTLPLQTCSELDRELDGQSAADWALAHELVGDRLRWTLEYASRDDYGCRLEDCSAWALLHYFCARRSPQSGESGEYLTWPEGNARLVRALAEGLDDRLRTRSVVVEIRRGAQGAEVDVLQLDGSAVTYEAEHVVLALPQYVVRRVLRGDEAAEARARFRYSPWVVANLHLRRLPQSRGFPPCWDNVSYDSDSLGYVDATHQLDRLERDRVWTWYLPLCDGPEVEQRALLLQRPWEHWRDLVLADLRRAHPDLDDCVTRLDVWRWGHAMVKPVPGFLWGEARRRAAARQGDVHFAHSDVAGLPLFEEAHWVGAAAAEAILRDRGHAFEALAG